MEFSEFLCILNISPLSDMWFGNIFSYFVVCLFLFLTRSFTEQKFLILMKLNLLIFFFKVALLEASLRTPSLGLIDFLL